MLVFTFPGQGSQRPGMGPRGPTTRAGSWSPMPTEAVDRDVAHLLLEADQEELTQTRNAQLACFTLSMVVLDAIERTGLAPVAAAGHSLGEYSALVAVGAIAFDDGVRLVAERGEAMQLAPGTAPAPWPPCSGSELDAFIGQPDPFARAFTLEGRPPKLVPKAIHDELVRRKMSKAHDILRDSIVRAAEVLREILDDKNADAAVRLQGCGDASRPRARQGHRAGGDIARQPY